MLAIDAPVPPCLDLALRASGAALLTRRGPPSLNAVESALDAYAAAIAAPRREGVTQSLPGDAAERFFALGFALEQMHQNFKDLERCVAEWAGSSKETEHKTVTDKPDCHKQTW